MERPLHLSSRLDATLSTQAVTHSARADVIYSLADLGGANHTVTGTITVTDTAADDGALASGEIDWVTVTSSAIARSLVNQFGADDIFTS